MSHEIKTTGDDAAFDQTLFLVSRKTYRKFVARLDAPPAPNSRLRRAMATPAPWKQPTKPRE